MTLEEVAMLTVLGRAGAVDIVVVAQDAMEAGRDAPSLTLLAGGLDVGHIERWKLFWGALDELGIPRPTRAEAVRSYVERLLNDIASGHKLFPDVCDIWPLVHLLDESEERKPPEDLWKVSLIFLELSEDYERYQDSEWLSARIAKNIRAQAALGLMWPRPEVPGWSTGLVYEKGWKEPGDNQLKPAVVRYDVDDPTRQAMETLASDLLEALDRLYDHEATVVEVQSLLAARMLEASSLTESIDMASIALARLIATGASDDDLNGPALVTVQPLREQAGRIWSDVWSGFRANRRMREIIESCGGSSPSAPNVQLRLLMEAAESGSNGALTPHLQAVADAGVMATDKLVYWTLFEANVPRQLDPPPQELMDLTGVECWVNDTALHHPGDGERDDCHYLNQGMLLAAALERLVVTDTTRRIRVILSVNGVSSTFRFHSMHDGESWLTKDLERYRDEAVATWVLPRP